MSTVRAAEKHNPDITSRPTLQSQLSSSVPSTPFQEPRRFHSRSPSPRRALENHSPRSVVSEAVEPTIVNGIQRVHTGPVVCKFETAPEWRKRRIPYIDGGDQDLAPPEKKPKPALEPDEEEKLESDMRELYNRLLPSDESELRRSELVKKLDRILNEEWPGNNIIVSVFGSSGNLLSSSDSDVDICVTTSLKKVESMHTLATLLNKHGMERVVCRAAAKVPIVKCWDPILELACDVNVNNPLALENTRMIKTYVQLDPRVRPLAKIIKYWTKQRILNDAAFGGTISSYTWICMIISFLQQREPPILPSLQKMKNLSGSSTNGKESEFADDIEALKGFGDKNKESLATLLFNFFRYYGYEFEYSKLVVSVKEGRRFSREEKGWDNYKENKEARCRLCVEEPFNTSRNLGNSADDYAWSGIHGEIRRAFELLADGVQLEKCCEEYIFPPEEKSIFQRPVARPTTLTRSASQSGSSGRSNHDPGARSRKGSNRNQSSHRSGNRRASSGSVFNNQRASMLQSPQLGISQYDYFAKQGLHEQLFQQYQYLQAQQDALRTQLVLREQQQQQQGQAPSPHLNATSSPQPRQGSFGSRLDQHPPQTAPLLPGSLYHFTARYPPQPSPSLGQSQKVKDGSNTNPSSPSMVHSVPALMRQGNRTSLAEGSNSAIRSQSQPGRSLPHPITLQQQVHPGYDVSGAFNARNAQQYPQVLPGYPFPINPMAYHNGLQVDPTLPKEYVGYYVGQSPQLGPQYSGAQMQVPSMTSLRDPVTRQRRVTPDLAPPATNGQQNSRSPSPLGHMRSPSLAGESAMSPPPILDPGAPLIVNGSKPAAKKPVANGIHRPMNGENALGLDLSAGQMMPIRQNRDRAHEDVLPERERSTSLTSKSLSRTSPHLNLSPTGTPPNGLDTTNLGHEPAVAAVIPLLSPVAELRTPSPTHGNRFESKEWQSQIATNGIDKSMKNIANTKVADVENAEPKAMEKRKPAETLSIHTDAKHERKGSAPNLTTEAMKTSKSPTSNIPMPLSAGHPTATIAQEKNPWQQATGRKGHKKNKSIAQTLNMQQSPVVEGERKGG